MTMKNLVAVRVLDGSTFYGRQLRVIAYGHAFSDCRDIDGTFCEDYAHCGTRNAHAAPLVVRVTEWRRWFSVCRLIYVLRRRQTDGRVFSTQVHFRTLSLNMIQVHSFLFIFYL